MALQGTAHSFTELHKPFYLDKAVIHEGGRPILDDLSKQYNQ